MHSGIGQSWNKRKTSIKKQAFYSTLATRVSWKNALKKKQFFKRCFRSDVLFQCLFSNVFLKNISQFLHLRSHFSKNFQIENERSSWFCRPQTWVFSAMNSVQSDLRNRIGTENLAKLAFCLLAFLKNFWKNVFQINKKHSKRFFVFFNKKRFFPTLLATLRHSTGVNLWTKITLSNLENNGAEDTLAMAANFYHTRYLACKNNVFSETRIASKSCRVKNWLEFDLE